MPKALFFNIPSSGHINPTLPIIKQLAESDLEIVYLNAENERAKVEATGTRFIAYPPDEQFSAFFDDVPTDNFSYNALNLYRIGRRLMPFILDTIESEKPDFIIFDSLANWGKSAAQITGIPSLAFVTTLIITPDALPPMPLKTIGMMIPQMLGALPPYFYEQWQMWRAYRTRPLFIMDVLMCLSDYNIIFTSRDLQPNGHNLGDSYQFVGTSIGERAEPADFPFDQLHTDRKTIYISLGTIARNNAFIRRCFEAFRDTEIQVVFSVGQQTDIQQLGTIPENFIVENFVPQLAILDRVDGFITHGGMNSMQEALLAGVPMVAIPQQPEQAIVASRLNTLGAGIGLQLTPPYGDVSADDLRNAVIQILDDAQYTEKSQLLGQALREAGGAERATALLLQFAETKTFSP